MSQSVARSLASYALIAIALTAVVLIATDGSRGDWIFVGSTLVAVAVGDFVLRPLLTRLWSRREA